MTGFQHRSKHTLLTLLLGLTVFASGQMPLHAAPGTLTSTPLYLSTAVEPNIVFLTDDSGSMDWTMMTDKADGVYSVISPVWEFPAYYTHPTPDNIYEEWYLANWGATAYVYTLPTHETMDANSAFLTANGYTDWDGVWRMRNSNYNKMYYNPTITYTPWIGVDNGGSTFSNSTPTAARLDPYLPATAANTVNLTTNWAFTSYIAHDINPGWLYSFADTMYPAYYYSWTDTDADGDVDSSDAHTKVEIKASTPNYTGRSSRTDCAAAPSCTYAEEIQNFANWFSYYRRRAHSTKNAIASVVSNINSARVGYGTINDNNNVKIQVASMNSDPASGNKKTLLDKVFSTAPNGGTPLRENMRDIGRYFECKAGNFYGASGASCPIFDSSNGGQCQQNFTILMTDGYYNGSSPDLNSSDGAPDDNTDGDDDTTFDGSSYADTHDNTLADVAMHYYERDLRTALDDEVPTTPGVDDADHQHMVTYTTAFGVSGTLDPNDTKTPGTASDTDPTDGGFSWPDPDNGSLEKIDDLWHASYNGRGQFLSAQNPDQLSSSLTTALADIVGRTSSAAAVAFNSTSLGTGSVVYLARFNSATWSGELLAHSLDPFTGAVSTTPTWNAATALDAQTPSSRIIYSYNDTTNAGVTFKTLNLLSASQQADLNTSPAGTADALGQDRIDYLRGDRSDEGTGNNFRIRSSVLGDIVHANPVFVGIPQMNFPDADPFGTSTDRYSTFKGTSRNGIIYVGANDGMLHGFNETTGQEVMAYVPNILFSNSATEGIHYLTDPGYNHRYYVDLSPSVSDVYVKTTTAGTAGWKTVLIGGLRGGGRGLFALDITDPNDFIDANADDIVMWEFTSNDDPDLGYTYSKPTIVMTNAVDGSSQNRWAAIFGNGYNGSGDGEAKLFIAFLDGGLNGSWTLGSDYIEITTDVGTVGSPNGLSTPAVVDLDGNGTADRVYAGDLEGNMWAIDLSSSSTNSWDIAYAQGSTEKALFNTGGEAITTKPVIARHPTQGTVANNEPNLMVFFGSGQFLVSSDKTSTDTQSMYGVWDDKPNGSALPYDRTDLLSQGFEASTTSTERVPTDVAVNYASQKGWYMDLTDTGERVVVNPKIRGGILFFNTLTPESSACSYGGDGWLMAVKLENGGRPTDSVFDVNNDGEVNATDRISGDTVGGIKFGEGLPAESNFLSDYQYTPGSTGEVAQNKIDTGDSASEGRFSWREIRD